ncbi:uncharacterized protein LOC123682664 isoform X2 [Harmonia axyridis]|uniref:uncharacterized protein LOC123682664 isoform X2 n=1 Tax=Harmonia axyridis TaxID=115357 RepID=UPI001E2755CC|nr:uncharacterized protein LOC123682664 isoform X2 [Harmonia axyridis]
MDEAEEINSFKGIDWDISVPEVFINVLFSNKYTQHGINWEYKARSVYSREKIPYSGKGLEVCQLDPRLVAFLNGVIFKNGESVKLLEIKCLFIGRIISAENTEHHCQYLRRGKAS